METTVAQTQRECIDEIKDELAALRAEVAELTKLIKVGNGHASLMEQAARNSEFRDWAEPFMRQLPMTMFKWWIATMLTLGGMIFGLLKLVS